MKKAKSILFLSALALGAAAMSGCSMFGGDNGGFTSYDYSVDSSTGDAYLTFYLDDEWADPFVVKIPNRAGTDGIGIDDVLINRGDTSVTLTILYTDGRSSIFSLPYGKDGLSIDGVIAETDPVTKDILISFMSGDQQIGDAVRIPMGNGIASITTRSNGDATTITISFTNGDSQSFDVRNGVGVNSITVDESQSNLLQYCLIVTYSDGFSEAIYLDKPTTTKWHSGMFDPTSSYPADPIVGDFYLNVSTGWVFQYSNGTWQPLFSMKTEETPDVERYSVVFNPNGGEWEDDHGTYAIRSVVEAGNTIDLSLIPCPVLPGYVFQGWYTDPSNVNAGQFTDLTVVTKSLTLYARWAQ